MTRIDLSQFEGATEGPWEVDSIKNEGDYGDGGPDCRSGYTSFAAYDKRGRVIFDSLNSEIAEVHEAFDDDRYAAWDEVARKDIKLAAAAPALRDELARVYGEVDRLRTLLAEMLPDLDPYSQWTQRKIDKISGALSETAP